MGCLRYLMFGFIVVTCIGIFKDQPQVMITQAGKTQENKSNAAANNVPKQKKNNAGSSSPFIDNRPETIAQMELQEMANSNTAGKQAAFSQPVTTTNTGVIQGRFIGALGDVLNALDPASIGASETYYNNLWTALRDSATEITVEDVAASTHFNPQTNTLNLNQRVLISLLQHRRAPLAADVLADHVALVTHELSHAHDSVIMGRELKGERGNDRGRNAETANVMMTELLAWEREARTKQRIIGAAEVPLWNGWLEVEAAMLVDFAALAANLDNEVVNRYHRYLSRELEDSPRRIAAWFASDQAAIISARIVQLSASLRQGVNTI